MPVNDLRVMGRATQGVRLIRLDDEDQIASVEKIDEVVVEEEAAALLLESQSEVNAEVQLPIEGAEIASDDSPESSNDETGNDEDDQTEAPENDEDRI